MAYSIKQLAKIAGISTRTLHYYDEIGLLSPARKQENAYRIYAEPELLRLQQILFFRELEFALEEIKKILDNPHFDLAQSLKDHRKMILLKKDRLNTLLTTIDKTLDKVTKQTHMPNNQLYSGLSDEQAKQYAQEAKQRWGHTEAYKQSQERVRAMGKAGLAKALKESGELTQEVATAMEAGLDPNSEVVQKLMARHYDSLRAFYQPNLELYKGLANMYVNDPRFKANYEKVALGLAKFMRDGMLCFATTHTKESF